MHHRTAAWLLVWLAWAAPVGAEGPTLLRPFRERVERISEPVWAAGVEGDLPADFTPWWETQMAGPLSPSGYGVDLEGLMLSGLANSARIRFLSEARQIAPTAILEAEGAFEWHGFADTKFVDTSEPVGSLLTTGGSPWYYDQNWTGAAGLRRRLDGGGQFEISQRVGFEDNNSIYFIPKPQGTALMTVSIARPLLRGAGVDYNNRLVALAQLETATSDQEFLKQSQAHLTEIARAYWQLYLARASLLQKQRVYEQARRIFEELDSRRRLDVVPAQTLEAKAAVAKRRAEILRAETTVRNTEARLRALVNDPQFADAPSVELVPLGGPARQPLPLGLRDALHRALSARPEILQGLNDVSAARVKVGVSENELLPALDLVLQAYTKGLEGRSAIGQAWVNQFSEGQPSYTIGLNFEIPLSNQVARARALRQQIELRKTICALANAVEGIMAEVEIAVRDAQTAFREMGAEYQAMLAKEEEVSCLEARWRVLAGEGDVATVMLQQLLQSQEGLSAAQFAFASAQVGYSQALVRLEQVQGTLLQLQPAPCGGFNTPPMVLEAQPGQARPVGGPSPNFLPAQTYRGPEPVRYPPAGPSVPIPPYQPVPSIAPPEVLPPSVPAGPAPPSGYDAQAAWMPTAPRVVRLPSP